MPARLQADVHVAAVGEDLVFLDIGADAYFCLPGAADALELGSDGQSLARCEDWLLHQLFAANLAGEGAPMTAAPRRPVLPDLPASELCREPVSVVDWSTVRRMAAAALSLYGKGYGGSLADLIEVAHRLRRHERAVPGEDLEATISLARQCEQLIPWVPFQGDCLFRSFLTLSVLRRAGHRVAWVFGVQTWPFRAHCWLQLEDLVLNDIAERVSGYAPIFVA